MEELQDALEDAQYVNAINVDEGPRPITAWENPSEEVLEEWKSDLLKTWEANPNNAAVPKPFEIEWVLSRALGLFLFSSFIKETCTSEEHNYARICFIEEVLRWRCLRGRSRGLKLRKIYERYLLPCATKKDEVTNETTKVLPTMTVVDELDMEYTHNGPRLDDKQLKEFIEKSTDESCAKCCIGLTNPLLEAVKNPIEVALLSIHRDGEDSAVSAVGKLNHMPDFSSIPELSLVMEEDTREEVPEAPEAPEAPKRSVIGSKHARES